ncbi:hypothetical protein RCH20_000331 [Psychrobacter sp. PL15]|jgi:hypothetical protein|uniref:hypothetical protein n=1 Tax=unclassified Psychrobacter TaxID=196806 RepID=UPI001AE39062|nr:hypothetical protein [Psychrobacter sp. PL15]MEC5209282.1 hypothetical protein [Psychrobacter sp. PL15]
MAASRSTTHSDRQSYRRQALLWLIMTLLLGVITALIWMVSQTPAMGAKIENAPISTPQMIGTELEQPLSVAALHELDTNVQPLNFDTTVRDLRNYPDEFKDKRYLLANKGSWTVQVMNVGENEVIANYLEGREDRKKFSYFRYRDDDDQLRYMLTYGLMSSPQEAVGAAKLIDFGLPDNVRVLPEEISRYVGIIDNYERPDPVKDLSARRTRSVNLQPTKREVPIRQNAQSSIGDNANGVATDNDGNPSNQQTNNNGGGIESIRQSNDTSETLSLTEERTVGPDEQNSSGSTPKNNDNSRKSEQESKKSIGTGTDNSTLKKPPAVATPKPPSNASNSSDSATSGNKPANSAATKNNSDSIKELIQEKAN